MPNQTDTQTNIPSVNPGFAATLNTNPVKLDSPKKMNPKMIIAIVIVAFLVLFGITYALLGNVFNKVKNSVDSTTNSMSAANDLNNAFSGLTTQPDFVTQQSVMTAEFLGSGTTANGKNVNDNLYLDSNFKISNLKDFDVNSPEKLLGDNVLIDGNISVGLTANYMGKVYDFPKGSFKLSILKPDAKVYVKATVTNDALDQIQKLYPDFNVSALSLFNDKYITLDTQTAQTGIEDSLKNLKNDSSMNPVSDANKKIVQDFLVKFAMSDAVTYSNTTSNDSAGNKVRNISLTIDHDKAKPMIAQFVTDLANEEMKTNPCKDDKATCDANLKTMSDVVSSVKIENLKFVLDDKTGSLLGYSANISLDDNGKSLLNAELKKDMPNSTADDIAQITDIKLNFNSLTTYSNTAITPETPTAPLDLTQMLGNFLGF